jgi:CxxC motif-containing protein (DUF1111 family)
MKEAVMKRGVVVLFSLFLVVNLGAQARLRPSAPPPQPPPPPQVQAGDAYAGLTAAQVALFIDGKGDFTEVETVNAGLGPVFNERSCAACHLAPTVGGGSGRLVTRFGTTTNGAFDALAQLGGSLIQDHAIGGRDGSPHNFRPEQVPQQATIVARRRTQPLYGLGLVDATADSDFIAMAALQSARGDGTAGRVNMVDNISAGTKMVGKFGWKAQNPTLFQFAGDAYLNEMGITSPQFPNENCPQGNCAELQFNPAPGINDTGDGPIALRNFMQMLAPPPRGTQNGDTTAGEQAFSRIGCDSCHVATLHSGASDVAALNRQTYHPYSDFLLHDMGSLGDGIEQGQASGREIRTAPLWGLRFIRQYLHDGRAVTLDQAIQAHDGQARAARDRYNALDPATKGKVLAFLGSL